MDIKNRHKGAFRERKNIEGKTTLSEQWTQKMASWYIFVEQICYWSKVNFLKKFKKIVRNILMDENWT